MTAVPPARQSADEQLVRELAEALWREDCGITAPPLSEASPASQRVCERTARALLPIVHAHTQARLAAVESLAETWERAAEEHFVRAQAPGANIGQRHSAWELGSEYESRAQALRAALDTTEESADGDR